MRERHFYCNLGSRFYFADEVKKSKSLSDFSSSIQCGSDSSLCRHFIFSEMGIGDIDIEQCLMGLPTWQSMTTQNRIAFFWWIAAVLFTLVLLWKVTGHSVFISMVFLGGIASEAVLYFHQRFMRREPVFII